MSSSPFSTDSKSSPGLLLWQVTTLWQREVASALSPHGITHAQFVIMAITMYLGITKGEATQADIIRMSNLDKMTVSTGLRKLEALKLLKREVHPHDTRIYLVALSSKGQTLTRKLVRIVEGVDKIFFGSLARSNQKTLLALLGALAHVEN